MENSLNPASIFKRLLAFILDILIIKGLFYLFTFFYPKTYFPQTFDSFYYQMTFWHEYLMISKWILIIWAIFLIVYSTSPGKYLLRLRVSVYPSDKRTPWYQILWREIILKPLDISLGTILFIFFSGVGRTPHDYFSRTWVISQKKKSPQT